MITIHNMDCIEGMRMLPDQSVDSIVTDPPYGISFMGKKWDYDVPAIEVWAECLRVLKPGGHLLAFAGTRTQHRMAVRIEDAGFEIRDMIAWVYGSGFPKSHNLNGDQQGWGTALKPALEPITVARKPLIGTVAENVLTHGTGGINIAGCRVPTPGETPKGSGRRDGNGNSYNLKDWAAPNGGNGGNVTPDAGRWPANLIHDGSDEVIECFPVTTSGSRAEGVRKGMGFHGAKGDGGPEIVGSTGSASRFFYCAKASKQDRDDGCEGIPKKSGGFISNTSGQHVTRRDDGYAVSPRSNNHPTVKPTELMRYLCRLITPPGGIVLDPFMGSGSTGKAAILEGLRFIGFEINHEYVEISRKRLDKVTRQGTLFGTA